MKVEIEFAKLSSACKYGHLKYCQDSHIEVEPICSLYKQVEI